MTQKLAILSNAKRPFNEMTVAQKIRLCVNYQKNSQGNNSPTLQLVLCKALTWECQVCDQNIDTSDFGDLLV